MTKTDQAIESAADKLARFVREAQASGDRVAAENLYQHAEHYFRIMNAQGEGQGHGPPRPTTT